MIKTKRDAKKSFSQFVGRLRCPDDGVWMCCGERYEKKWQIDRHVGKEHGVELVAEYSTHCPRPSMNFWLPSGAITSSSTDQYGCRVVVWKLENTLLSGEFYSPPIHVKTKGNKELVCQVRCDIGSTWTVSMNILSWSSPEGVDAWSIVRYEAIMEDSGEKRINGYVTAVGHRSVQYYVGEDYKFKGPLTITSKLKIKGDEILMDEEESTQIDRKKREKEMKIREEKIKIEEEEMKIKFEEMKIKSEEVKQKEEEMKIKLGEMKLKEEEMKIKLGEMKLKEAEMKMGEYETKIKGEEKKKGEEIEKQTELMKTQYMKDEEVKKIGKDKEIREGEVRRREEIVRRQEEVMRREEEIGRRQEEVMRREDEIGRRQEEVMRREGEMVTREGEMVTREGEMVTREEEMVGREGEVVRREEEVVRREENVVKREEEVVRREENVVRREENVGRREENVVRREENVVRREENVGRREGKVGRREGEVGRREGDTNKRDEEIKREAGQLKGKERDIEIKQESVSNPESTFLSELFDEQVSREITIMVEGGGSLLAHRNILVRGSKILSAVLEDVSPGQPQTIHMTGVHVDVVKALLFYLYRGEIPDLPRVMLRGGLIELAARFGVEGVRENVVTFMRGEGNITVENAAMVWMEAKIHGIEDVREKALQLMEGHSTEVTMTNGWKLAAENHPEIRDMITKEDD